MGIGLYTASPEDEQFARSVISGWNVKPQEEPNFFTGALTAPFEGVGHALAVASSAALDVAADDDGYDSSAIDGFLSEGRRKAHRWMESSRPDPNDMGTLAQVGHGLGSVLTMGVMGAPLGVYGAAGSIGALSAYDKYQEMLKQGVDTNTALQTAGITGAVMSIGAGLPGFVGNTIKKQVLSGIGINVGLGAAERAATSAVLEDNGYTNMAESYKTLDATSMAIDAVLGAAFPVGARFIKKPMRELPPDAEVAAALTAESKVAEMYRDPVVHTELEGIARKQAAAEEYTRQVLQDGKALDEAEVPHNIADNTITNPVFDATMEKGVKALDVAFKESNDIGLSKLVNEYKSVSEILNKEPENAIQEPSATEVDVRKQTADGEAMGERNIQRQEATGTRQAKEEIDFTREHAMEVLKQQPDMIVKDDDGVTMKASELIAKAEAEFKQAKIESTLVETAVNCALQVGE